MKHRHCALIIPWAMGKVRIQKLSAGIWYECPNPLWLDHVTYRVVALDSPMLPLSPNNVTVVYDADKIHSAKLD